MPASAKAMTTRWSSWPLTCVPLSALVPYGQTVFVLRDRRSHPGKLFAHDRDPVGLLDACLGDIDKTGFALRGAGGNRERRQRVGHGVEVDGPAMQPIVPETVTPSGPWRPPRPCTAAPRTRPCRPEGRKSQDP